MSANQNDPQYKLRWSSDLREKIAESAKTHNRSMNADIVARLEQSFKTKPSSPMMIEFKSTDVQAFFHALIQRLEENDVATDHFSDVLKEFHQAQKKAP